jgi:hypothetical protein
MNIMRREISAFIFIVLCTSVSGQETLHRKLESEAYTINESTVQGSPPVAFSIGYPKGWTKAENTAPFFEGVTSVEIHQVVCTFTSPLDPIDPSAPRTGIVTNCASITIFRAYGATAKEEAEDLAARVRKMGDEIQSLAPVKTGSSEPGYLLMSSDDTPLGHRLRSEFFFCIGRKGHIRISIYVMGTFLGMRENLQNLVLESLRFPQAHESLQPTTR